MKSCFRQIFLVFVLFFLAGCSFIQPPQSGKPTIQEIDAALNEGIKHRQGMIEKNAPPPEEIESELLPSLSIKAPAKDDEQESRFDLSVNNVPAESFFAGLVKGTSLNMIVSPKIKGNITLTLKNITIEEALQAVRDSYGYQYKRTPYGYQIFPDEIETRIFTINYLDINRSGNSKTTVNSGQISQSISGSSSGTTGTSAPTPPNAGGAGAGSDSGSAVSSIKTNSDNDFWKILEKTLKEMIGTKEDRQVIVNPEAGTVIVKASADELEAVSKYIDSIQSVMTRQVILEAKVIEIELDNEFQSGVDWSLFGSSNGLLQTGSQSFSDSLSPFTNMFAISGKYEKSFFGIIKLLSTQGNVQTLSSPRIATLNNQQAVIKVGNDQFFITNISSTTTGTSSTTSAATQNVSFTPFFSGIALIVTPQISADGSIILHIHPLVSSVSSKTLGYKINGQDQSVPLAYSTVRESDSVIHAQNGQIVVIGGLMEDRSEEQMASTPGLDKTPVAGPLFRRTHQVGGKSELIILLRPIVPDSNTWIKELQNAKKRVKTLDRGFHYGSFPEEFGNAAEKRQPDVS